MITAEAAAAVGLTPKKFRTLFRRIHLESCWLDDTPRPCKLPARQSLRVPEEIGEHEREEIAQKYRDGVRVRDIARLFRTRERSIYRIVDMMGVKRAMRRDCG